jgi:hypothetical protein
MRSRRVSQRQSRKSGQLQSRGDRLAFTHCALGCFTLSNSDGIWCGGWCLLFGLVKWIPCVLRGTCTFEIIYQCLDFFTFLMASFNRKIVTL